MNYILEIHAKLIEQTVRSGSVDSDKTALNKKLRLQFNCSDKNTK